MSPPFIIVGPGVLLYINGQRYSRVAGFQWTLAIDQKEIFAVDSSSAYELVPGQARAMGVIDVYRLKGDGGATGAQLTTQFQDILRQRYFTVSLVERTTGEILFEASRCSLVTQSWKAPGRGFVTGQFNFKCLEADEGSPSAPA